MSKKLFDAQVAQYALQENEDYGIVALENGIACVMPESTLTYCHPQNYTKWINRSDTWMQDWGPPSGLDQVVLNENFTLHGKTSIKFNIMPGKGWSTDPSCVFMQLWQIALNINNTAPEVLCEIQAGKYSYYLSIYRDNNNIIFKQHSTENDQVIIYQYNATVQTYDTSNRSLNIARDGLTWNGIYISANGTPWSQSFWQDNEEYTIIIRGIMSNYQTINPSENIDIQVSYIECFNYNYLVFPAYNLATTTYGIVTFSYEQIGQESGSFFPVMNSQESDDGIEQYYISNLIQPSAPLKIFNTLDFILPDSLQSVPGIRITNNEIIIEPERGTQTYLISEENDNVDLTQIPTNINIYKTTSTLLDLCPMIEFGEQLVIDFNCSNQNINFLALLYQHIDSPEPPELILWHKNESLIINDSLQCYTLCFAYEIDDQLVSYTNLGLKHFNTEENAWQVLSSHYDYIDFTEINDKFTSAEDQIIIKSTEHKVICKSHYRLYDLATITNFTLTPYIPESPLGSTDFYCFELTSLDDVNLNNIATIVDTSHFDVFKTENIQDYITKPGTWLAYDVVNNKIIFKFDLNSPQGHSLIKAVGNDFSAESAIQWLQLNKVQLLIQWKEPQFDDISHTSVGQKLLQLNEYNQYTILTYAGLNKITELHNKQLGQITVKYLVHTKDKKEATELTLQDNSILNIKVDNKNKYIENTNDILSLNIKRGGVSWLIQE